MTKIILPIAELKPALTGLGKIIAKRTTLPVLGMLKLDRTKDGWITLTSTDLDTFITVRLEQPAEGDPESMLVSHEDICRITKRCGKDESLLIEKAKGDKALVTFPIGNQTAEEHVPSLPVEEFPPVLRIKNESVSPTNDIRLSLLDAFECASVDETRLVLNAAYIDVSKPDGHYIIGTDGRQLYSSNSFTLALKESLIIPSNKFLGWKDFNADGEWQIRVQQPEKKDDKGLSAEDIIIEAFYVGDNEHRSWIKDLLVFWCWTAERKNPEAAFFSRVLEVIVKTQVVEVLPHLLALMGEERQFFLSTSSLYEDNLHLNVMVALRSLPSAIPLDWSRYLDRPHYALVAFAGLVDQDLGIALEYLPRFLAVTHASPATAPIREMLLTLVHRFKREDIVGRIFHAAFCMKVVTFYSFKGGVGRSMALANVAHIMASTKDRRVLMVDFDLEAPGLSFMPYFAPEKPSKCGGVFEFLLAWQSGHKPDLSDYLAESAQHKNEGLHLAMIRSGDLHPDRMI